MVMITLPDGSQKKFDGAISGADLAASIGAGLAKAALAIEVDGKLVDLTTTIEADAHVRIITAKDAAGLEIIRHSTAHILAQAVKELYPAAQITIGPVIEHGFYYDMSFPEPISADDLVMIEGRMRDIVKADLPIMRDVWDRDHAIRYFEGIGEAYKAEIIRDLPAGEAISVYQQGIVEDGTSEDHRPQPFIDLCRGPHLPSTGKAGAFKLLNLAGAYWRGDSKHRPDSAT